MVWTQRITSGQVLLSIQKHEPAQDGHGVFLEMVRFYELKHNMMVVAQKCYVALNGLVLKKGSQGGPEKFLSLFQNTYLDLEYSTGTVKDDLEKKSKLLMAIQDSTFFAVRDLLSNDPNKSFEDCIVTLGQHNVC